MQGVEKLVVLAAGMGTRMRSAQLAEGLSAQQREVAETGVKALIPVGRPFLDYVLHRAADAGITRVCLVIGPRHDQLRRYYTEQPLHRLRITFAIQSEPLGTAHALAVAESFVAADPFLMLNSDNCYPTECLRALRAAAGPAVVGFDRDALMANSNLPAQRLARFAVIATSRQGELVQIIEKPDPETMRSMQPPVWVGMNCWRFSPRIFASCQAIARSPRGEFELTDAVAHSMQQQRERYQVIPSVGPVLDLSSQLDIGSVTRQLSGEEVSL